MHLPPQVLHLTFLYPTQEEHVTARVFRFMYPLAPQSKQGRKPELSQAKQSINDADTFGLLLLLLSPRRRAMVAFVTTGI
jgi:hypothetical protein